MLDLTTKLGLRAEKRLKEDYFTWLTTVRRDGVPQPNPVWFYWDGEALLIYSQPAAHKVRHITGNSKVSATFQANANGEDFIVLTGIANIDPSSSGHDPRYVEKYRDLITQFGFTRESYAASYSTLIRVIPNKLRGL